MNIIFWGLTNKYKIIKAVEVANSVLVEENIQENIEKYHITDLIGRNIKQMKTGQIY